MKKISVIMMSLALLMGCKKAEKPDGEVNTSADFTLAGSEFVKISESVLRSYIVTPFVLRNGTVTCDSLTQISGDTLPTSARTYTRLAAGSSCGIKAIATRSGTLKIMQWGRVNAPDNKMTIKLKDYNKALGAKAYTFSCDSLVLNNIRQVNGKWVYQLNVLNGKMQDGAAIITLALTATVTVLDREVSLLLAGNGASRDGKKFNFSQDTDPVFKASDCEHFTVGSVGIAPEGASTRFIDYGAGGCDFEADVYFLDLHSAKEQIQEANRMRIELK